MRTYRYLLLFSILAVSAMSVLGCFEPSIHEMDFHPDKPAVPPVEQALISMFTNSVTPVEQPTDQLNLIKQPFFHEFSSAEIVGLGEATHGTYEFFQSKFALIRELVEKHGFRTILFEMDFAEAMLFNEFIHDRSDLTIEELINEKMIFWAWKTQTIRDLLIWIQNFNSIQSENDKVYFFGLDVQYTTFDADLIIHMYNSFDPETAEYFGKILLPYKNIHLYYRNGASEADISLVQSGIGIVTKSIKDREQEIKDAIGESQYHLLNRLGRHLQQTEWIRYNVSINNGISDRDPFMAENALWILREFRPAQKAILWAHNGHVANDPSYYGKGSLGRFLKDAFKNKYQILGFGFSRGEFNATNGDVGLQRFAILDDPISGSVNEMFHRTGLSAFSFQVQDLPLEVNDWLSAKRNMLSIGSVYLGSPGDYYIEMVMRDYFDAVIYFDQTTSSLLLQ